MYIFAFAISASQLLKYYDLHAMIVVQRLKRNPRWPCCKTPQSQVSRKVNRGASDTLSQCNGYKQQTTKPKKAKTRNARTPIVRTNINAMDIPIQHPISKQRVRKKTCAARVAVV